MWRSPRQETIVRSHPLLFALPLLCAACFPEPVVDLDEDGFVGVKDGGTDCDDGDAAIRPDAVERCNGVDDDCDGAVDEEDDSVTGLHLFYPDADGDGYGAAVEPELACDAPEGMVGNAADVDDDNRGDYLDSDDTFVGYADADILSWEPLSVLNEACQASWPASYICTDVALAQVSPHPPLEGDAWVLFTVAAAFERDGETVYVNPLGIETEDEPNCDLGWGQNSNYGLVHGGSGFQIARCDTTVTVACCGPEEEAVDR